MYETVINHHPKPQYNYPMLMISEKKTIVLMTEYGKGFCIDPGNATSFKKGEHLTTWNMPLFKPFTGEVTLKNE